MQALKILLAVPSLQGLGVQHDIRTLLLHWDHAQFDVRMLLHSRTGDFADQFPPDMKSIHVMEFSLNIPKIQVLTWMQGYKRAIEYFQPDAVISFVPYSNYGCVYAKLMGKHRFGLCISEHAHVTAAMQDDENMGNPFMGIYRKTFRYVYNLPTVNEVKCIAEESKQDLINKHGIHPDKVTLIYNPIPMKEILKLSHEPVEHEWFLNKQMPILINVGRLCRQKQQDHLIRAFAQVRRAIACKLVFVGKGDQTALRKLARDLQIEGEIAFVGFQANPWKWMAKADLFVLASMWEGLPCVLSESMLLGVPIVSTRCPSGPIEMLLHGEAGYLCQVGDINDLSEKMLFALTYPETTQHKVDVARTHLYRFEPERITRQYENLAQRLAHSAMI